MCFVKKRCKGRHFILNDKQIWFLFLGMQQTPLFAPRFRFGVQSYYQVDPPFLVITLPRLGSVAPGAWKCRSHGLGVTLPGVGSPAPLVGMSDRGKVVHIAIAVEVQVFRISSLAEEVDDPLLLFGREQPLAVVVAVVGGVSAQVSLDAVAQGRVVLLLHLGKEGAEAVGGVDDARLLVVFAVSLLAGGGVDGFALCRFGRDVLSGQEAGAGVRLRAVCLEAAGVRGGYLVGCQG